jgi:MFS family permease
MSCVLLCDVPRAPRGRDTHQTGADAEIFPPLPLPVKQCEAPAIGKLRGHLAESTAALTRVFRNPSLRRIEIAFAGSIVGVYATGVIVSVYAYHHGGATAVGLVMFARMGAAALAAPFAATLADRHEQRHVMLATDLIRVVTVAATAVAAASHVSALVYLLVTLTSVVSTAFRPAEASLVPQLAASPEELTAANVSSSTFDSVGAFLGPAVGAVVYAVAGPAPAFAVVAAAYLWSATFLVRLPRTERPARPEHAHEDAEGLAAGFRAVRSEPRLRLIIGLYSAQTLVAGAYGVLVVLIALQLLDLGNAGVGLLQAATGVGAILGALLTLVLVGRKRTAGDFGVGLFCFGAGLLAVAALPHTWAAVVGLAVLGVGNSVVDVSAITLLQRTTPRAVAGRVFGLLDAALIGALGLGSVATPLLVHLVGVRASLVVAGAILPVFAIATRRLLAAVDRSAAVPDEQLDAIAAVPFLDVLPVQQKEALAVALERIELPAGSTLFSQGQPGDQLYIVTAGAIEIDLPEGPKLERAPTFTGEIALLHDVPRTATVRVVEDATLWALEGARFLDAVVGHTRSRSAADAVVAARGVALSA